MAGMREMLKGMRGGATSVGAGASAALRGLSNNPFVNPREMAAIGNVSGAAMPPEEIRTQALQNLRQLSGAAISEEELRQEIERLSQSLNPEEQLRKQAAMELRDISGAAISETEIDDYVQILKEREANQVLKERGGMPVVPPEEIQNYIQMKYGAPATMPMGGLRGQTGAMLTEQEIGEFMRPSTGAQFTEGELNRAMMPPQRETGAVINDADVDYGFGRPQAMSSPEIDAARQAVEKTMSPEELNAAIDALVMQKQGTNDPEELEEIDKAIELTMVQGQAPYNDLMNQLALTGGEDDMIAHVRTGDVNLSKELITPQIEELIGAQAEKAGIDPETMTYGNGIATLRNTTTGLEQHGWLKKTAKSIKKKGRVIAQVASVIPGPWQIPATMATKAYTAYDVAKGNISPIQAAAQWAGANKAAAGARASVAAGTQPSGNIFARTKEFFKSGADGKNFYQNITEAPKFDSKTGDMSGGSVFGRAKEYLLPGQDKVGLLGNLGQTFGMGGGQQKSEYTPMADSMDGPITGYMDANGNIITTDQYDQLGSFFGGQTPQGIKSIGDAIGLGGPSGLRDVYGGGGQGGQGGGGMGGLGSLAGMALAGGIAGKLGKLAYDEAKDSKGVSLSPVVAMDATGRYNLEAEMARRMGQQAPNPTEFGLLPANTFPQLSGGQRLSQAFNNEEPQEQVMAAAMGGEVMKYKDGGGAGIEALRKVAPEVVERMGYNMGGQAMMPMNYNMGGQAMMPMNYNMGGRAMMPMAYAEGGNVAMEDFNRMNGQINGEGTETSDDIPAMLSDGEFVMTGQAVRGAGSYKMKNDSGIVTLTPNGAPNRDSGTEMMYQLMEAFSSRTGPA